MQPPARPFLQQTKCWICQPRIFCICTCRLDCICPVSVVFVPPSEPSICRMSVRGGDVRAGADLAPRPGPTLQRHVLRPLRVRPGKSLFNSTFSPADWRVYLCLGLKVLRMDPTSLHNQKLVCELLKSIKSDKLSDPERQKLNSSSAGDEIGPG